MNKQAYITNLLHLACKAGKVRVGMSASCSSCLKERARLVVCAADLSDNSKNKIERIARRQNVRFLVYGNKELYSRIFKRCITGILSIEDKNFASGILKALA